MMPLTMPNGSSRTLTTGARQLVVQLALEMMLCLAGIVLVLVDAENEGDVFVGRRSGDDDLLDGRAEVSLRLGRIGKVAGRFNDDLRAHISPGKLGGVAFGPHLDLFAVDGDEVVAGVDLVRQVSQESSRT